MTSVLWRPAGETRGRAGTIVNVSQGGLVLSAGEGVPLGRELEMRFPEPLFGAHTARGCVVWSQRKGDAVSMGCRFLPGPIALPESGGVELEAGAVGVERRRHRRREQPLELTVRCVTEGPFQEGKYRMATLRDMSQGGVEIVTAHEYVKGLSLEVRFPPSAIGPEHVRLARVLRSRGSERRGLFALGCSFLPADGRGADDNVSARQKAAGVLAMRRGTLSTAARTGQGSRETDRRFFERLPQRSVLRVMDPRTPSSDQFAILRDISRSGARLEVASPFDSGTKIVLYLPKTQFGPPRTVRGRVMWCTESPDSVGWHQIGCRFAK